MASRLILSREIITIYSEDHTANNKYTVGSKRVRFSEVTARQRQKDFTTNGSCSVIGADVLIRVHISKCKQIRHSFIDLRRNLFLSHTQNISILMMLVWACLLLRFLFQKNKRVCPVICVIKSCLFARS